MSAPLPSLAQVHVLIIDDQPDELRQLIEMFRRAGCRISVAFDGAQGYQRALAGAPDVVLMDVHLPVLDGLGACRLLQNDPATAAIPVILLGAVGDLDERLEGLRSGAVDYVPKPFAPEEMLARVAIHIGRMPRPQRPVPAAPTALSKDQVLVSAARQYLAGHLADPPGLRQLAHEVGTHEKRLSRAFREHLGMTVYEFVREERLRVARRLLAETSLSITAIAGELGFSSAANFATAFREKVGSTPSAFREAARRGGTRARA